MKSLFDKDFFKFTIGFMLILVSSFCLLAVTHYYDTAVNASVGTSVDALTNSR
jgi:hypothetical protein